MPSRELTLLCEQIEKQDTDNFGKFYMYVSLLNTVAVRNKPFADTLPKYSKGLAVWRDKELKVGEISLEFSQQLNQYAQSFGNPKADWTNVLYNVVMTYVRKGKITDLTYIIDQMLNQLSRIHGPQTHNQNIYEYIHFSEKKASLTGFINQISILNHQILSAADSGCNAGLSVLAATTGLVLVLASIFSLAPAILGLGLLIGGAYGVYHYVTQLEAQIKQVEHQIEKISEKMKELPKDESLFGDKNYNRFFAAVLLPLPYAAITTAEQLMTDESRQTTLTEQRHDLDQLSTILSI